VLLLERAKVRPPVGAALEILTAPVDAAPPSTIDGLTWRLIKVGAVTARVTVLVVEPCVPVMVAVTLEATAVVETLKAAVV